MINNAGELYSKWFLNILWFSKFPKESLENYDYIQQLFLEYFIQFLNPNDKNDAIIIKYYMGDLAASKFEYFKKTYNRLMSELKKKSKIIK